MPHLLDRLTAPLIFGHRGASAFAPENTLAAFRLALEHGADGIELDTKLTADGQVVVIHDQTVNRTTGGAGRVIDMTLAQLKQLDAGSSFAPAFRGEPIPTLAEVFEEVGAQTLINVEIANYASLFDALPQKIAALVAQFGLQERVMFSSFSPVALRRIQRLLPGAPAAILAMPGLAGCPMRGWLGSLVTPNLVHPHHSDVSAANLAAAHARQRRVNTWTVNDPAEMRRLFDSKIDGIITDDPRLARSVLSQMA